MTPRHTLLALLVVLIWGLNFVVIHIGLAGVPPILFAALRFVVLLPALLFVPRPDVGWRGLASVGLLMSAGQFGLLYLAMSVGLPAGLASLVLQAQVLLTVLFAALVLGERPRPVQLGGVLIGVIGLVVVAVGRQAATPLISLLIVLGAAMSWAAGNVAARRLRSTSGLGLVVWGSLFVPLPLLALSLVFEGPARIGDALMHFTVSAAWSTAYTAVLSTLVCYGIWNTLLARYRAADVVPFTLLVPVVGMASAAFFLGERPNLVELIGGLILLVGVAIAVIRLSPPARPASQENSPHTLMLPNASRP
ncbi:MAG: EamA family transporter [Micropruina sp.]